MKSIYFKTALALAATLNLGDSAWAAKILSNKVNISVRSTPVGAQDFAARCAAPGVVKCVGFDQASDIAGTFGENSGIFSGSNNAPQLDTAVRASGNSSLRFTVTTSSASSGGSYFTNFSSDLQTQFDSGQTFYVQWRQRFDTQYATMNLGSFGNGGWKQVIVGSGDKPGCTKSNSLTIDSGGFCTSSCTPLETVVQNTYHRGFPVMYNSCSGSSSTQNGKYAGGTGPYVPFEEPFNGFDFKLQNAMPAPYCLYSQGATNSYFPPKGNCFGYAANEWMTFKMRIVIGTRTNDYFKGSHVDLWVSRQGQAPAHVFNWNWDLAAGPAAQNLKFGKIWLLTYNSNNAGNNNAPVPTAQTWYDDLIISTQDIADPK
ncbi:MAG: hypothetical protein AB7N80_14855 [Bdellovibrionales bacterium]